MGLIKGMLFTDNYHKIDSVELNLKKRRLIIRTEVFKDIAKESFGIHREYTIDEFTLIKEMRLKALAKVTASSVKKQVESKIKKWEAANEKKADKGSKDLIVKQEIDHAVGKLQNEMAVNSINSILAELNVKGIIPVAYGCLKMLSVFAGSKDK